MSKTEVDCQRLYDVCLKGKVAEGDNVGICRPGLHAEEVCGCHQKSFDGELSVFI